MGRGALGSPAFFPIPDLKISTVAPTRYPPYVSMFVTSNTYPMKPEASALLIAFLCPPFASLAGGACAVAKHLGNSKAYAWLARPGLAPAEAQAEAERRLLARGLGKGRRAGVFTQAVSPLEHGWFVLVETRYVTWSGHYRTSYGCGFDARSAKAARSAAVRNLQAYSWEWKPDKGFEVREEKRF